MKKPIDFNQSGYNAHLKDIQTAEAVLLELVSEFKELVGNEPQDLEEFLKDPYTYTGELLTQGVKVEGLDLSLDKKLFLKDIDLKTIHSAYDQLKQVVKEAELTLLDFTPDYKVKEEVLKDIQETYTTYAITKAEKEFHKRLEALVESYNGIHSHLKEKGLTPNVMSFLIGRSDLEGIKVNTQAFKLISRSLNRS
jgi:hypothetical protein